MKWLYEAKERYRTSILDFTITSNHVHVLLLDKEGRSSISKCMQLVSARTAQSHNWRKGRKGAFWEDRYHGTAVESGAHLINCIIYIDLNMVRAGVVGHPAEWAFGGYSMIQEGPKRRRLIDYESLRELLHFEDFKTLQASHRALVDEALKRRCLERESKWTESVAVGSKAYLEEFLEKSGSRTGSRRIVGNGGAFELMEDCFPYTHKNRLSSPR
jgi:putative transposase